MKSIILKPVMVIALLILASCANDSERILTQAPQSHEDLGFLVSGATEEQKNTFFQDNKSVKIREISNDGIIMFEAVNSDISTLRKNFPDSRIFKNEFMQYTDVPNQTLNLNQIKNLGFKLSGVDSTFDLQSCKDDTLKPIAKMTPVSANLSARKPIEMGERIQLTSKDSQPHAFVGGPINKAWLIEAPMGSNVPELTFKNDLDIELDTMGVYKIYLVIQDQKKNCQLDNVSISVTGNKPYLGSSAPSLDTSIANQLYLQKLGVNNAHKLSTGKNIVIAIVDSGVNYNHPYLSENIYTNKDEIPDNGLDDDGNGLIDDVHGWDFVYNDKFPYDDLGHGSHVAGLAAGKVFGIAPDATILPIKAGNNSGMLDIGTTFKAVIYALKMKADIINLSLGGERQVFKEELELYKQALSKDTLIVAAAGNGEPSRLGIFLGVDIDNKSYAPAGVDLENILTVASLSTNDRLAYYSNFGLHKVSVATYGGEDFDLVNKIAYNGQLFSTYIENAKGELFFAAQGTSMVTLVATGISALVRSLNPNLTAGQTSKLLQTAGPEVKDLNGKIKSGRILTAEGAVQMAQSSLNLIN
jgi:subtilisin family serine protease